MNNTYKASNNANYADDVTVFINGQEDVINLTKSIEVYESASTVKVNWSKCEGYAVGQWIIKGFQIYRAG